MPKYQPTALPTGAYRLNSKYIDQWIVDADGNVIGQTGSNGRDTFFYSSTVAAVGPVSAGNALSSMAYQAASSVAITGGTINGASVGVTTPAVVKASDFQAARTDISGTPGNGTANTARGRAAFAAAGSSVVVSNSLVAATSTVLVQLGGSDATLTTVRVTAAAGSFTVTGNAAATGTTPFDFLVIN